jgi:predicted secreted protein
MVFKRALATAGLLFLSVLPAAANGIVNSTVSTNETQRIYVDRGQIFIVALPADQSKGYTWKASVRQGRVSALGGAFQETGSLKDGSPAENVFVFRADGSGTAILRFTSARPGDAAVGDVKYFNVTVR